MTPKYKIEKSSDRYTARNRKGEALAFISKEDDNLLRVDYQLPWGWEDTYIAGNFNDLDEAEAKKIFANFL